MVGCVCGSVDFRKENREGYITDEKGTSVPSNVPVAICSHCGVIRQIDLPFSTEKKYEEYYSKKYPPAGKKYSAQDYRSNLINQEKRFVNFDLKGSKKVLDVGCGSGALIEICRKKGVKAFGCEIVKYHYAPNSFYIYFKRFEDIHFPTDHFDRIVCCDVIEHVLDPGRFLSEMFRVTEQEGICYIELPDFFGEQGEGHWKKIEHIWYFTVDQFEKLLEKVGFEVNNISRKAGAKLIFSVKKPIQKRVSLLLPPGIGDVYWSLIKVESFLKEKGITAPVDAYTAAPREKAYNSHARAFPFLEMFPFLHSTEEVVFNKRSGVWHEAYLEQKKSVFENVFGCDYFISYNGHLRAGKALDDLDPHLKCNWVMDRFISLEEEDYKKQAMAKYGKYLVLYWVFQGSNKSIFKHFTIEEIAQAINDIVDATGLKPIFIGARWDKDDEQLAKLISLIPNSTDLLSKTSIAEAFGLIRGSEAVIGIPSGMTIMSAVFKIKTILLWGSFYTSNGVHRDFAKNVFPPAIWKKTYFAEYADKITAEGFAARVISVVNKKKFSKKKSYIRQEGQEYEKKSWPVDKKKKLIMPSVRSVEKDVDQKIFAPNSLPGISVFCVLKSGGDYTIDYVVKLRNMIKRHSTVDYEFVCLTDVDIDESICKSIKLVREYNGWWSKIEIFRPDLVKTGRIVYFDLDTVILKNIDDILTYDYNISALQPWNERNRKNGLCASGMMAWRNDGSFSFLFSQFDPGKTKKYSRGDQEYISEILANNGTSPEFFQKIFSGIYSYKRNCRKGIPKDAQIICFHGRPRPHEMKDKWMRENWR